MLSRARKVRFSTLDQAVSHLTKIVTPKCFIFCIRNLFAILFERE